MNRATKHLLGLLVTFIVGLFVGTITLALYSFAMPIREFGSGYGTFIIWFRMLVGYYAGAYLVAVTPFLTIVRERFPKLSFKKRISIVASAFLLLETIVVVSWQAYDYWFVAIPFGLIAIISSFAIVSVHSRCMNRLMAES